MSQREPDHPSLPGGCQPAADAACGHCPDCREQEARRFDALLGAQLDAIRQRALAQRTS